MRRVLLILLLLLAGALVNVAVAWGIAIRLGAVGVDFVFEDPYGRDEAALFEWWANHLPNGFQGQPNVSYFSYSLFGASFDLASTHRVSIPEPLWFEAVFRVRTGWPVRAMEGASWKGSDNRLVYQRAVETGDHHEGFGIPLSPIWPGFAVNTLFYAAVLWPLICGPFALRRLVRRHRGLCPACAYPMGESATCTECGKPLPGRTEAAT